MSKPTAVATVIALTLTAVGTAGCGGPERLHVEGPAPKPTQATGPVYVSDTLGHPLRRPTAIGLTEFTTLTRLRWRSWGKPKAVATGKLSGNWCIPKCTDSPYPATLELSRLERQENVSYYTRATVRSSHLPPADSGEDLRDVPLPVPEP
ncbi:hypothetical protein FCH28_33515 [Streptomyces piniterrae]|uniref:Lipoprotein n=1 Tax=Streptomyces piniterrae TaxID=2571125 RepID=A0A4U0MPY8_9ACTN|nr:hypothetical protein [Streptomyces piniterrae]TJZ42813.1 hypothetical protein FCH28_33515 [Streptomyces piniterrae]